MSSQSYALCAAVDSVDAMHAAIMAAIADERRQHGADPEARSILCDALLLVIQRLGEIDPAIPEAMRLLLERPGAPP